MAGNNNAGSKMMTTRDLIKLLSECEMDAEVGIEASFSDFNFKADVLEIATVTAISNQGFADLCTLIVLSKA